MSLKKEKPSKVEQSLSKFDSKSKIIQNPRLLKILESELEYGEDLNNGTILISGYSEDLNSIGSKSILFEDHISNGLVFKGSVFSHICRVPYFKSLYHVKACLRQVAQYCVAVGLIL